MKTITQFTSIASFSTAQLLAKKLEQRDLEQLIIMHQNPEVMKTLGGKLATREEVAERLHLELTHWDKHHFGIWMFYLKKTGEWVGRAGIRHIQLENTPEVELAYALMPSFWNRGLATEIAKASIEVAFEALHLKEVVCFTTTTNHASKRVMEKTGFKYERDFIYKDLPHVLYRISNT